MLRTIEMRKQIVKLDSKLRSAKNDLSSFETRRLEAELSAKKKALKSAMREKFGSKRTPTGWAEGDTKTFEEARTSRMLVLELRRMLRILRKPAAERHPFAWKLQKIADTINEALELKWKTTT